jgi:hypothetical protein
MLLLGRTEEAVRASGGVGPAPRARLLAHAGKAAEAKLAMRPLLGRRVEDLAIGEAPILLDAMIALNDRDGVTRLLPAVRPSDRAAASGGFAAMLTPARLLGAASAFLGDHAQARKDYTLAVELSSKIRSRPEMALARLGLAQILLDHYPAERGEAVEHLDFAIAEFRDMKMQPSLERALKRKDILKA